MLDLCNAGIVDFQWVTALDSKNFDQFDAFEGDGMTGAIGAEEIAAFLEIPKAELELLARDSEEIEEIAQAHGGLVGLGKALAVENGQNFVSLAMLVGKGGGRSGLLELIAFGLIARIAMLHVVFGALLGIAEGLIGIRNLAERIGAARLLVIGMEALGLHAINPVHRFLIGVRADLQCLVVVDEH